VACGVRHANRGWVNQPIAYILLGIAFVWSVCTIIYWWKHKWGNKRVRIWVSLVTVAIVGVAIALIVTHPTQTRPKLRIDFDSPATYTYTTNSTGEISLRIVNNGESAACQYYAIVFAAPENQLQQVKRLKQEFGTNCIEPTELAYCNVHLNFTNQPTGVCYIYYKLIYSNSPTGGHLYTNDSPYWFSCDFTNAQKSFTQLTPAQRDIFKAAIKAYYPDQDIE
jgi:hypothetical protein